MRVLLDTHAFLWWIADSGRLSVAARQVIADEANDIVVSAASASEITTRYRISKLPGAEPVALDVAGAISAPRASDTFQSASSTPNARDGCPDLTATPSTGCLPRRLWRATWRSYQRMRHWTPTESAGSGDGVPPVTLT